MFQPPKFKMLGYNKKKMPIFRMTDLYLTDNPQVRSTIDDELNKAIYGGRQVSMGFSSKFDNRNELAEILAKWENKEEEDFGGQRNNLMNEQELEQAVVNMGEEKKDYFLYMTRQSQKVETRKVENNPLSHPNFLHNLHKTVDRMQSRFQKV